MKITYSQILNSKAIPKSCLYLIYGDPYHLINETESILKKNLSLEANYSTHYIDNDFSLEEIRNDCESTSLFNNSDVVILNIVSSSIPKKLSDYLQNIKLLSGITVIIKFTKSVNLIRKNKFLDFVERQYVALEIRPLNNNNLDQWLKLKFNSLGIDYDNKSLELIKESHDGNTTNMSQEIYKISILKPARLDEYLSSIHMTSKYSEFDLIDSILCQNQKRSLKVLRYLRDSNVSEVYVLYLLQNEVRKFLYLRQNLSPKPYIPSFKQKQYNSLMSIFKPSFLESLIRRCFTLDKYIKSNSEMEYVWDNFEEMIVMLTSSPQRDMIERILGYEY
tara:strand:- start:2729 stop:3730 length:1002 start_codon:yes stop_codon:yes gene_type:complete